MIPLVSIVLWDLLHSIDPSICRYRPLTCLLPEEQRSDPATRGARTDPRCFDGLDTRTFDSVELESCLRFHRCPIWTRRAGCVIHVTDQSISCGADAPCQASMPSLNHSRKREKHTAAREQVERTVELLIGIKSHQPFYSPISRCDGPCNAPKNHERSMKKNRPTKHFFHLLDESRRTTGNYQRRSAEGVLPMR